ncbi:MAG: hypothetical protein ACXVA9_12805 [Bdellovibrionales bacterium]
MTKVNKMAAAVALITVILTACATYKDVRPMDDGVNRVAIVTDNVEGATRKCIKEANNYCKAHGNTEPHFLDENSKYTGDMNEEDYKDLKRASSVVKTVGGAVWVFGGQRERTLGGLGVLAGAGMDSAAGKGYTVEMRFRCR